MVKAAVGVGLAGGSEAQLWTAEFESPTRQPGGNTQ